MDEQSLKAALPFVPALQFFESTGSTNDIAMSWAAQGAHDFSLVVANHQSAGRGRLQRRWITTAGSALAFSLVLRPTSIEAEHLSFFTALGALALSDVLKEQYGLVSMIKWPNDVLLNHRKTAGILVEAAWQGDVVQSVILGIGVNVALESVPPEEEVLYPATCVESALGKEVNRMEFLAALLERIKFLRPEMRSPRFLEAWQRHLAFQGEAVQVTESDATILTGILSGLNEDGSLRLQTEAGTIYSIQVGDIRLRPVKTHS
ncbi:MAG: biotin--[acetyl-CoA-carboxylase] ligase [Anaerolineaceae bacterium]|nr:biotin--[acetyl-CoA-carboxylase] ligase [Anaerolineaceae bacterium]